MVCVLQRLVHSIQAADDFCGVNYTLEPDGCLGARSLKLLVALQQMLVPFERPRSCETPMDPAIVPLLSALPSESNPLLPERVASARSILGLGMYVVRGTRSDGLFAATALAPLVVVNLTRVALFGLPCFVGRTTWLTPARLACSFARLHPGCPQRSAHAQIQVPSTIHCPVPPRLPRCPWRVWAGSRSSSLVLDRSSANAALLSTSPTVAPAPNSTLPPGPVKQSSRSACFKPSFAWVRLGLRPWRLTLMPCSTASPWIKYQGNSVF